MDRNRPGWRGPLTRRVHRFTSGWASKSCHSEPFWAIVSHPLVMGRRTRRRQAGLASPPSTGSGQASASSGRTGETDGLGRRGRGFPCRGTGMTEATAGHTGALTRRLLGFTSGGKLFSLYHFVAFCSICPLGRGRRPAARRAELARGDRVEARRRLGNGQLSWRRQAGRRGARIRVGPGSLRPRERLDSRVEASR